MSFRLPLLACLGLILVIPTHAMENTAGGGDLVRTDTNNLAMRLESLETAMTVAYENLNTEVERIKACNTLGKTYVPTAPHADDNGCIYPDKLRILGTGHLNFNYDTPPSTYHCKPIQFEAGWPADKITLLGTAKHRATGSWGHWPVLFGNINAAAGTANACIDSGGGYSGGIGAEIIDWVAFGQTD